MPLGSTTRRRRVTSRRADRRDATRRRRRHRPEGPTGSGPADLCEGAGAGGEPSRSPAADDRRPARPPSGSPRPPSGSAARPVDEQDPDDGREAEHEQGGAPFAQEHDAKEGSHDRVQVDVDRDMRGRQPGQRPGPELERDGATQHAEEHRQAEQAPVQPLDRRDQALDQRRRSRISVPISIA